jgi:hypothetical protein
MITATISAYLCLRQLNEFKNVTRKGVTTPRKQPRFDLTLIAGYWQSLDKLKNHKGKIFFNLIPTEQNQYRKQDGTTPEYYLQISPAKSKSINFSGIRFQYQDGNKLMFASGEPSMEKVLKGGVANPMFDNRNDGFLFLFSDNMEQLEILVIENGRTLIDAYRKQLAMGGLNRHLDELRKQAKLVSYL